MLACALCWLPGNHQLVLLGEGRLARLDAVASPPEVQLSVEAALHVPVQQACMAADPRGEVVIVLSRPLPQSEETEAALTVFSSASLAQLSSSTFTMAGASWLNSYELRDSVRVSLHAVVVCCQCQYPGTRVFAIDAGQLGASFWVPDLHSPNLSTDGAFLCGLRERTHVVIDARTGHQLFQLPPLTFDTAQPSAQAASTAWGAGGNQLHAGFSGGEQGPETKEDTICLWSILTF